MGSESVIETETGLCDELKTLRARVDAAEREAAERRAAEQALRDNESRYRSLVVATSQIVWTTNGKGEVVNDIPSWRAFTGQTEQEIQGWGWLSAIHPEDQASVRHKWTRAVANQSLYEAEYQLRKYDGTYRRFLVRGVPVVDGDNWPWRYWPGPDFSLHNVSLVDEGTRIREWIGTCTDITEHKLAEEQLRDSQRLIQRIADSTPHILFLFDLVEMRTVYVNDRSTAILGYTPSEIQRMGNELVSAVAHPDDFAQIIEHFRHRFDQTRDGEVVEAQYRLRHANGEYRWLNMSLTVFTRTAAGLPYVILGTAQDVTDRKRAEEQMRRAHEELARLECQQREIEKLAIAGRMAAQVAHEINNPLAGIRNSFLLIRDAIPPDHRYFEYVGRIGKEIDRIARIVRQMFDLYRPDQEAARHFPVDQCIGDVVALLEPSCREYRVDIVLDLPDSSMEVFLPEALLRQVLFNVLVNAIEESPRDGEVRVSAIVARDRLTIAVADRGPGIPANIRDHIFEPFFTTKSGKSRGGLGLGLSISKSLLDVMDGSLEVDSQVGQGTVFRIVIPSNGKGKELKNG
jgi:PAS domain S-box-containing protein